MDEQWSFVGSKKQQRWLFYAWEPRFKKIIAHAFGFRSTETLKKLLERLARFKVSFYCTDDWQPYTSCLPEDKHIIGKYFTQRIERQNLTLRTCLKRLARRTICFSRSIDIHDKVIGEFISRNHYQQFWYITQKPSRPRCWKSGSWVCGRRSCPWAGPCFQWTSQARYLRLSQRCEEASG